MKINKIITLVCLIALNTQANTVKINPQFKNDFNKNSTSVTSVSEVLANKKLSESIDINNKYNQLLNKHCAAEKEIFCSQSNTDILSCLKNNFDLMTGNCHKILNAENKVGVSKNHLSIHDLKLPKSTKYFGSKNKNTHKDSQYKAEGVFDYRGIRFKKGFLTARSYAYSSYKGQYIISSAHPKSIFTDNSGIEYNPHWQKGPFFFDVNGNVSIGTLSKTIEYKKYIYLKKGTLVVFNDKRELIKGTIAKSVRIGSCGFLKEMEISEEKIKSCN